MANVVVATLGNSPIVVTAMFKALLELKNVSVQTLHVLYSGIETERLIGLGYDMIAEHLRGVCQVRSWPLPFADPNSYEASIQFLRILAGVLELCEQAGDTVYLSLAGGRKNMSALLAVISQFYPCVRGLYHLLDCFEYDDRQRNFYTIQELVDMDESKRAEKLSPSVEGLNLVEIPYACFANANELRRYFAAEERGEKFILEDSGIAEAFFGSVFHSGRSASLLNVHLSRTAYEDFQMLVAKGSGHVEKFLKCFRQMQDPYALKGYMHGTFGGIDKIFHFFKLRRTVERPFYFTRPNPIHLFPQRPVESVTICGLSIEQPDGSYVPSAKELQERAEISPYKHLNALTTDEAVLLVPLGESPMIAIQIYMLLQEREDLEIAPIVILYPEGHAPVRNSAELLENLWVVSIFLCKIFNIQFFEER